MTSLEDILQELTPERRRGIEEGAQAIIAEEMTLQDLRRALELTQVSLAKQLGINQENVSRIENRDDLLLSTLNKYVCATGGKLSLVVEYPGRPPVVLKGISALDEEAEADWSGFVVASSE
ncbi:MAG: XRE family transcriptional regulator [Chloroflexi bacterium]|nr:XRE family transcriptional regulator [Chloroflexota bacterium]